MHADINFVHVANTKLNYFIESIFNTIVFNLYLHVG